MTKSMLSLEFWGAKKEAPEARKQEFVLSLEFLGGPKRAPEAEFHEKRKNRALARVFHMKKLTF